MPVRHITDTAIAIWKRLRLPEAVMLAVLLVIVLVAWGFIELADEVLEGDTQAFDVWVLRSLRTAENLSVPLGPQWLVEMARDLTALGSGAVLLAMITIVAGYLGLQRKYHAMWLVLGAAVTGLLMSAALKSVFGRERPDAVPHLTEVTSTSFPSGHALMASVVYLTLGALLMRVTSSRRMKLYILTVSVGIAGVIGLTRVFLGVHYPTDVMGGWAAGLAWALLCWVVALWLQRRGAVEEPDDPRPPD